MHPDPLAPLQTPLTELRGVGPAVAALMERAVGGRRVLDLLWHLPQGFVDRRARPTLREAVPGEVATVAVEVVRHEAPATPRQPWRVVVRDATGLAELVFFRQARLRSMPPGARLLVSGRFELYGGRLTMAHPDHVVDADRPGLMPAVEPVWGLTAGLFPGHLRSAYAQALALLPELPEWQEPTVLRRERWPGFAQALRALHAPQALPDEAARRRLAYDELLAQQLAMAWMRARERARPGRAMPGDESLRPLLLARFGHDLTSSQAEVLGEIDADLAAPRRMLRLLQGDVGSGKTLVAAMAMLRAVESGAQAALMAPTEVLARQHHRTLSRLCPVPVGLLTGSVKGVARRNLLLGLEAGRVRLVVGTHALFQEGVAYADLGLAVIDEQHRFGVDQRLLLGAKGSRTDVLVMTATPIPRSLLLAQWGEMTVSRLLGKPAGRQPIRTTLHSLATVDGVLEGVARALARGERLYWVCPMVAESELIDLAAAEARYATLHARFGDTVGLAHGQQDPDVRDAALADFAAGRRRLLVATTVIEVGVDVPEASRHGDRARRALRPGAAAPAARAGGARGGRQLLPAAARGRAHRGRAGALVLLRDTEDGFVIADEDFRLRGGGELLGTAPIRAAGLPPVRPGGRGPAAARPPRRRPAAGPRPEARGRARTGGPAAAAAVRAGRGAAGAGVGVGKAKGLCPLDPHQRASPLDTLGFGSGGRPTPMLHPRPQGKG